MATYTNESVVTSFSAVKYNPTTKTYAAYTPTSAGVITVAQNDIIRFIHYDRQKMCSLSNIVIYAIGGDMKIQTNGNSANPIMINSGESKCLDGMMIEQIVALTAGTIYYEGMTLSPMHIIED